DEEMGYIAGGRPVETRAPDEHDVERLHVDPECVQVGHHVLESSLSVTLTIGEAPEAELRQPEDQFAVHGMHVDDADLLVAAQIPLDLPLLRRAVVVALVEIPRQRRRIVLQPSGVVGAEARAAWLPRAANRPEASRYRPILPAADAVRRILQVREGETGE